MRRGNIRIKRSRTKTRIGRRKELCKRRRKRKPEKKEREMKKIWEAKLDVTVL